MGGAVSAGDQPLRGLERDRVGDAPRGFEGGYRTLFEKSSDGIVIDELETTALRYANSAISRMLGYAVSELCVMGQADIHPKEVGQHVLAEFQALARGEGNVAVDRSEE